MKIATEIVRWLRGAGRAGVVLALMVSAVSASAADDIRELLLWQGQACVGNRITLTKNITVTTAELTIQRDLEIDLNGCDLCIKNVGSELKPFTGNITLVNANATASHAYFPFCFQASSTNAAENVSGSLTVGSGVTFGPTYFDMTDSISSAFSMGEEKHISILGGATYDHAGFIGSRFCAEALLLEEGALVSQDIRDAIANGAGAAWTAADTAVSGSPLGNGLYTIIKTAQAGAVIAVTKAFTAWPWRDRLYVGYRVDGIKNHGVDYRVQLYASAGSMQNKLLYSYTSDNDIEHLVTSGHHEVQFDTDGVLGTGLASFFPQNLYTANAAITAVLSYKENGQWIEISRSTKSGIFFDNRSKKIVPLGGTYPVAYSGVGWVGVPGILTAVTYTKPEWKQTSWWPHIWYIDPCLVKFKTAHIEVGTQNWTPTACGEYHWQHQNGLEIYGNTIHVVDKMTDVPTGLTLPYNGTWQQGVPSGAGYSLSGTYKAKDAGSYTAKLTLNTGYVWTDGSSGAKEISWRITPRNILGFNVKLDGAEYIYDGTEIKPKATIENLELGKEYEVVGYENNINAGVGSVILRGKGNYTGEISCLFTIKRAGIKVPTARSFTYDGTTHTSIDANVAYTLDGTTSAKNVNTYSVGATPTANYRWSDHEPDTEKVIQSWRIDRGNIAKVAPGKTTLSPASFTYDGTAKTPTVTVKDLTAGVDFDVSYEENVNAGTATVRLTGKGQLYGEYELSFPIDRASVEGRTITVSPASVAGDGTAKTPTVSVAGLTKDVDYTVEYKNNVDVGTATVVVKGIGNYTGEASTTFTITGRDIAGWTVTVSPTSFEYDGTRKCPTVALVDPETGNPVNVNFYDVSISRNENAGLALVTVTGKNGFTGSTTTTFPITARSIAGCTATAPSVTYDGTAKTPAVTVTDPARGVTLIPGTDYTVAYKDNVNAGTATVTVTGKGNYAGSTSTTFTITSGQLQAAKFKLAESTTVYSGAAKTPAVIATGYVADTDYTVAYAENVNAGTATVTITGTGNYAGSSVTKTFTIQKKQIGELEMTFDPAEFYYDGTDKTPTPVITYGELTLVADTDYDSVVYENNREVGRPTATVIGRGNYEGTLTGQFTINGKQILDSMVVLGESSYAYDGTAKTPDVTVTDGAFRLTAGEDYTVEYQDNTAAGTATVKVTGKGNYAGTVEKTFTIAATKFTAAEVTIAPTNFVYNGSAQTPTATVRGGTLKAPTDFTVTCENNVNVGTATVIVEGAGNYAGSAVTNTFIITPADLSKKTVTVDPATVTFTGDGVQPAVLIAGLTAGKDFDVTYANNVDVGWATATVTGKGNYRGTASTMFEIERMSIQTNAITLGVADAGEWDRTAKEPAVTITNGTHVLVAGKDFDVTYSDNVNAGSSAKATVTGKGNYTGTREVTFSIAKRNVKPAEYTDYFEFTGLKQSGVAAGTDSAYYTISGQATASAIGTYTATVALNDKHNSQWNDGTSADKTYVWKITEPGVNPDGIYVIRSESSLDLMLPNYVDEGTVTVEISDELLALIDEDDYIIIPCSNNIYKVARAGWSDTVPFNLDTRLERVLAVDSSGTIPTETLTHSASAWGAVEDPSTTATIGFTRNSDTPLTLGTYADEETATWKPTRNGRYVFTHAPGDLSAVFIVSDLELEGSGTVDDPYVVYDRQQFARAVALGKTSPVYIRLGCNMAGPLEVTGDKSVVVDLNGMTVTGADGADGDSTLAGCDGDGALIVESGSSCTLEGAGTLIGGNGGDALGGTPGKGAKAITGDVTTSAGTDARDGVDGKAGDGSERYPYLVKTAAEYVAAIGDATTEPVWIRLMADIGETIAVAQAKNTIFDLNGHTVRGGAGQPGIDYQSAANLTLTNTSATAGNVYGGDGADGAPGQDGGAGVRLNGSLTVRANVNVTGGNGGDATVGSKTAGGAGGPGVAGALAYNDGTVTGGNGGLSDSGDDTAGGKAATGGPQPTPGEGEEKDGKTGAGTAAHPYVVYSAEELEQVVADHAGDTVYVRLGDSIGAVTLDGVKSVSIDLNDFDIDARSTELSDNGASGIAFGTSGAGTLTLTGAGTVYGADGRVAGGKAVSASTNRFAKEAGVTLVDGRVGDGTAEHPYEVATREELEERLAEDTTHDPVHFVLTTNIIGTVTIDEDKGVVIDLKGHDIVTTDRDAKGNGLPGLNVTGKGDVTITDTNDEPKGTVFGADGANGGGAGGSGVVIATGTLTVTNGATIRGGNGGAHDSGKGGAGGKAVTGAYTGTEGDGCGHVVDGTAGQSGAGTKGNPFKVWNVAELEAAVESARSRSMADVYINFETNILGSATLAGDINIHLDLQGFDMTGTDGVTAGPGEDGHDGQPAITTGNGAGTLEVTGPGTLTGGRGGDDWGADGKPGKGAEAIVRNGLGAKTLTNGAKEVKGADGRTGDGSAEHPYLISKPEDVGQIKKGDPDPLYLQLIADLTDTLVLSNGLNIVLDMNGYDIDGATDQDGSGHPGIDVTKGGTLDITNTTDEVSFVRGGNGTEPGDAVTNVEPTVRERVTLLPGIRGNGSAEKPYVVYSAEEFERAVAAGAADEPIHIELGADIGPVTFDSAKNVSLDMKGFNIVAGTDATTGAGKNAITFAAGTSTLELTNSTDVVSTVIGGDGTVAGLAATDRTRVSKSANVELIDGQDGSAAHPWKVATREELEEKLANDTTQDPICFELVSNLVGTVTIDEDKNVVIDLKGHDITSGTGQDSNGLVGLDVTGKGNVTITDTNDEPKGTVFGGDGVNGGDGGYGVVIATGTLTVTNGATVKGGNGGANDTGNGGAGAPGVLGTFTGTDAEDSVRGYVIAGEKGLSGAGTEDRPYEVSTAVALTNAVKLAEGRLSEVYIKVVGDIAGSANIVTDIGVHIDLNGHTMKGDTGAAKQGETPAADGIPAIVMSGAGSLEVKGPGTVEGGNGGDDFDTATPGKGGAAVAYSGDGTFETTHGAELKTGDDGRSGDGSAEHPYLVGPVDEIEKLLKDDTTHQPVCFKLTNDVNQTVSLNKNVRIDMNGFDINGTLGDDKKNGKAGIELVGEISLELINTADEESFVRGGDGLVGGEAIQTQGGTVTVQPATDEQPGVTLKDGMSGNGSADAPYVVYSAAEFEAAVAKGTAGETIYIELGADIDPVTFDSAKNASLEMAGHTIKAGTNPDGDGASGITFAAGTSTLALTGQKGDGEVIGGNGRIGGKAVSDATRLSSRDDNVTLTDGRDGNGTEEYPFVVRTKEELREVLAIEDAPKPIHIRLGNDFTGPVTIDGDRDVILDLYGHDIRGTVNESGNGTFGLELTTTNALMIVDTFDGTKGVIAGGNGVSGMTSGVNGGRGGNGIYTTGGAVSIAEEVTVYGGNGGNTLDAKPGMGVVAILGTKGTIAGTLVDGRNGVAGDGTSEHPYQVWTADELEYVVNGTNQTPMSVVFMDNMKRGVTLDGAKDLTLDLGGFAICGRNGSTNGVDSVHGESGLAFTAGSGTLTLVGPGLIVGGDGANATATTEAGKGAKAIAAGHTVVMDEKDGDVELSDGRNGWPAAGTKEDPIHVKDADELEEFVNDLRDGDGKVYIILDDDIDRTVTLDGDGEVVLDLNGHYIHGDSDENDDPKPALDVRETTGTLEIVGPGKVIGGDAVKEGAEGAHPLSPNVLSLFLMQDIGVDGEGEPNSAVTGDAELLNGLSGTGRKNDPYLISKPEELARALEEGTSPIYLKLVADFDTTFLIDVDKDVVLDLNDHNITGPAGAAGGADEDGEDGGPGILVTGTNNLTIVNNNAVTADKGIVRGGLGGNSKDGTAGNGGVGVVMNGGKLTIKDSNSLVIGGDGGNTIEGTPGFGGEGALTPGREIGGESENVLPGADGQSVKSELQLIFGPTIQIEEDGNGKLIVHLTQDLTGPIYIPDSIGEIDISFDGYSIVGADGNNGNDGKPAIVLTKTGAGPAVIGLINKGYVTGGAGGDFDVGAGGAGGAGIMFEEGANVQLSIGKDIVVTGGVGGKGATTGGTGGTGVIGDIAVNDGKICGGKGGVGASTEYGAAGNGGTGGDSLDGTITSGSGTRQGGDGGDGGNTRYGTPGYGGQGGDQGLTTQGKTGHNGSKEEGNIVILEDAFGGPENVDVRQDPVTRKYIVEFKQDITPTNSVTFPDSIGNVIIDLKGHNLLGADGTEDDPDGQPALIIRSTGTAPVTRTVEIINSVPATGGLVKGGDGADGDPAGDGGAAVVVTDGYPTWIKVGDHVTLEGGKGGNSTTGHAGDGGNGVNGRTTGNDGTIKGGNGGTTTEGGLPGGGAPAVSGTQLTPKGTTIDGTDGAPAIRLIAVRQRYPWNGLVDVDYEVIGADATGNDFALVFTSKKYENLLDILEYTATTVTATNFVGEVSLTQGTHRLTWNAASDCAEVLDTLEVQGDLTLSVGPTSLLASGDVPRGLTVTEKVSFDLRTGTEANPLTIEKASELKSLTYSGFGWVLGAEAATATVTVTHKGETTTLTSATDEASFVWTPSEAGDYHLVHTVGGQTEEAWLRVADKATQNKKFDLSVLFREKDGEKDPAQSEKPQTFLEKILQFTQEWLEEHDVETKDKTPQQVIDNLRKTDDNGYPHWVNLITGQDGAKPAFNDIGVNKNSNQLTVSGMGLSAVASEHEAVDAVYVLKKLVNGEWVEVEGATSTTPSFNIPLEPDDPTGYYRIFLRLKSTDKATDAKQ